MANYCTYSDVVGDEGLSGLESGDVTSIFVTKAIEDATAEINRIVGNPVEIDYEIHVADGNRHLFNLDFTDGGITRIKRLSLNGVLSLQPIPENADWVSTFGNWDVVDGSISNTTDGPANASCIKVTKQGSTTSILTYPDTAEIPLLAQSIDGYKFLVLFVKPTSDEKTFIIRLMRDDSNYLESTFTPELSGLYNMIHMHIDDFVETGDVSNNDRGITREINKIEIEVDDETYSLDGICFADYYAPVLNSSQFMWSDRNNLPVRGSKFEASYSIDIFDTVPDDVKMAAASLASSTVWSRFGGKRYRKTGGVMRVDTLDGKTDRYFSFEGIVSRYRKLGLDKINGYVGGPEMAWTEEDEEVFG